MSKDFKPASYQVGTLRTEGRNTQSPELCLPRSSQGQMAKSSDTTHDAIQTQAQPDACTSSPQPCVLAAEEENIRRLQHEVFCIESTLRAIGKKNSCSKEVITLKAKLDAANEELDAVLEDQQHLMSISSEDASQDLLSLTSDELQLLVTPPCSPKRPSTLLLSDDLRQLEDLLNKTPKWSIPWFEIKTEIVSLKKEHGIVSQEKTGPATPHQQKKCEPQNDAEDETKLMSPPRIQKVTDNPTIYLKSREPPAIGNLKNESIFRRNSADDADSVRRSISTVKTALTRDSSACCANACATKMVVTVTVISVDGLTARKYEPNSKLPTQLKKNDLSIGDTVTIVASFSQTFSGKEFQTHLPSDPIEVETPVIPTQSFPQQLVEWPSDEDDVTLGGNNIELSTYKYSREFELEKQRGGKSSAKRLTPQTCPINISISRHGKMLSLGKANLVITGEERGISTTVVPIYIDHGQQKSKVKNMKKLLKGKKSSPMVRIQGDNVQFGLENDAMLRVLVSVRAGSSGQKVKEAVNMNQPAHAIEPSGNLCQDKSVEGHRDKAYKNAGDERAASNPDATTSSAQLDQRIERIKASIRPLNETKSEPMLPKDSKKCGVGSPNSDEFLAQSVFNDVRPTPASHHPTKGEPKSIEIDLSSMKDELPQKQVYKSSPGADELLLEVCTSLNFDIAEMWLHEGDSYHLINAHIQPSAVTKSTAFRQHLIYSDVQPSALTKLMCDELHDVYHGEGSSEQTHRLSMSICKWAKKTGKMLWITEHQTPRLAQALKYSISGVRAAVAVPLCQEGTYATVIYFSMEASNEEAFALGAEDYLKKTSEKLFLMAK